MKVWLVGKKSMLGRSLIDLLQQKEIDYLSSSKEEVDITSFSHVEKFVEEKDFTHIINCAAYTDVDQAEINKELAFQVNVVGVDNLASVAEKNQLQVVHFSTDYVFDGKSQEPLKEEDVLAPCNVYGDTKKQGEEKLLQKVPEAVIIRSSWLFGEGQKHFIAKILRKMQEEEEIFVVADQIGKPTVCDDLAKATISLLSSKGIFHFANAGEVSWYELALFIYNTAKKLGFSLKCKKIYPVKSYEFPSLARRPSYSVLNTQKIKKYLEISINSWQQAVKEYMQQYFHSLWQ